MTQECAAWKARWSDGWGKRQSESDRNDSALTDRLKVTWFFFVFVHVLLLSNSVRSRFTGENNALYRAGQDG